MKARTHINFTQDEDDPQEERLPFFEDASASDGWRGVTSEKSYEVIRSEIREALGRMNATVTRFVRGEYTINGIDRPGVEIHYQIVREDGTPFLGVIQIAGPPYRETTRGTRAGSADKSNRAKADKSLRMALLNVRDALIANRNLTKLSPGFAPLISWMLPKEGETRTLGQLWNETIGVRALMPPKAPTDGEIVESTFREA